MFDKIVNHCSYLLNNSPQADSCRDYLDKRLKKETQEKFGFGFFPDEENCSLLTNFISNDDLKSLNLIYSKSFNDLQFVRNVNIYFFEDHPLIMPYRDLYGDIVGLVGRSLLPDAERPHNVPKYKNTDFKKGEHLFGLFEAKRYILESDFVYIVEGQFDMIKAYEQGIKNVVALGNSNMTECQLSILCRYTNNIIFLLDNDKAGDIGRERAYKKYNKHANINVNTYVPQQYKDIDEYFKENKDMNLVYFS